MKKILLILLFLPFVALANDFTNQGILNDSVDLAAQKEIIENKNLASLRAISEVNLTNNFKATKKDDEINDFKGAARVFTNVKIFKDLNFSALFNAERVNDENYQNDGSGRYFERIGAYAQEINLNYHQKEYSLIAGKFNLNFGNAWRWDRGIWIHQIADGYRQNEKLGFAAVYRLGDAQTTGQYNFSLSAFTNDRKNFDNSIIHNRQSPSKSDAKAGDTRSLSSINVGLNINFDFGEDEKLNYNFSYLRQAVNRHASQVASNKIDDEDDFVAGINYLYPLNQNLKIDFLTEYSELKNVGGNSDVTERYGTYLLKTYYRKNWNFLAGYSAISRKITNLSGFDQNISEASIGYDFNKTCLFDRLTIQSGIKRLFTNNANASETLSGVGFLIRYYKYF